MRNNHIDYIEFRAGDLEAVKKFYHHCFGWEFTDYGPDYTAFDRSGVQGGFRRTNDPIAQGVLVVLYHEALEQIRDTIQTAGAKITQDIFSFPGGRRFHFLDPAGNELAIWSEP